jgi:hypothetical protein
MRCPKETCLREFVHTINPQNGKHEEHECSFCGQLLQWDQSMIPSSSGNLRTGPPKACNHLDLKKPGALVPLDC